VACLHFSYERRACTCLPHLSHSPLSQTLSVTLTLAPYFDFCKRRSFIFAHSRLHSLPLPCCARSIRCVWEGLFYLYLFRPVDLERLCVRPHPSARDSFPLVTCGFLHRRTKGRPSSRLHSDTQVSQQETPKTMHLRIGAPCMAL